MPSDPEVAAHEPAPCSVDRRMGDTELSYYLPARSSGVNDMCILHIGFDAPGHLVQRPRVRLVWAILRMQHPLLSYEDVRFDALDDADNNLEYRPCHQGWYCLSLSLIGDYLNGEPHFLGDGMALHQFANEFFGLLAALQELEILLTEEWNRSCRLSPGKVFTLPSCLEDNLVPEPSNLRQVDYQLSQRKHIGGQAFPRKSQQPRRTIVPTVSYDANRTKSVLKRCKEKGVSISAALFAICNIAWARVGNGPPDLPTQYFKISPPHNSYWFLAVGYFNVVLPNFIPRSIEPSSTFWHRARSAKAQSAQVAKNPMFVSRCRLMAEERGKCGTYTPPAPAPTPAQPTKPPVPSSALLGLSLLGNLDGIYKHATLPAVKLHTLTTGSRQRSGGMLLFGYTFAGKLWVSLGYDENGFDKEVVETYWQNVLGAIGRVLPWSVQVESL
ncbi:hypothetical protein BKA83DRAFT_644792 [Pisolithus microcarpus]|nr:hypothetical protein BKA83DRAFT_644792 [Pisolithus microcarpus]